MKLGTLPIGAPRLVDPPPLKKNQQIECSCLTTNRNHSYPPPLYM